MLKVGRAVITNDGRIGILYSIKSRNSYFVKFVETGEVVKYSPSELRSAR